MQMIMHKRKIMHDENNRPSLDTQLPAASECVDNQGTLLLTQTSSYDEVKNYQLNHFTLTWTCKKKSIHVDRLLNFEKKKIIYTRTASFMYEVETWWFQIEILLFHEWYLPSTTNVWYYTILYNHHT